ncbi:MAG: TerB family tellurite resistance protein [Cyanophyceae cyanobacterium]
MNTKQLLKILIGAAWIDGMVQPEERRYLRRMAAEQGVADDVEIRPLLFELKPVKPAECYGWLEDYLGDHPSQEDYERLLKAMSALIYSDGNIDTQEAKLLTRLQGLDPARETPKGVFYRLLKIIQKLYRQQIHQEV